MYECCRSCIRPKNEEDKLWCHCPVKDLEIERKDPDSYRRAEEGAARIRKEWAEEDAAKLNRK